MVLSRTLKAAVLAAAVAASVGCDSDGSGQRFFSNGFLDPSETGRFDKKPLVVGMLHSLDTGIEERDDRFVNATDPRPSDLQVVKQDYTIGAGDLIQISIMDLVTEGVEWLKQIRVADSGNISLPYVGQVKAAGLSESQLEDAIVSAYKDKNMLPKAIVSVVTVEARNRSYSIYGAVTQSGQYAILQSDFRLLDALIQARDTTSTTGIDYIYILRKNTRDVGGDSATGGSTDNGNAAPATQEVPNSLAPKLLIMQDAAQPATAPAGSAENHIIVVGDKPMQIEGGQPNPMAATQPSDTVTSTATPTPPGAAPMNSGTMAGGTSGTGSTFAFNGLAEPTDVRVIKIPFEALKRGELKYNVVVRPEDTIWVPQPSVGEYYMGGHVQRTGVYSLSARTITLTQAVISAGGLDQLAIPQRTEIVRRLGENREIIASVDLEKVFAGEEPDIILKPDDQVRVGTNFFAPFLSAFRSGFRITYGAGFIYDRNYYNQNNNQ